MLDQLGGIGHRGVDHPGRTAERDPPPVAGRDTDQAAHDEEHRDEHERDAPDDRDEADPTIAPDGDPDPEGDDDERCVLLDEQRQNDEDGVHAPSPLERSVDREADEHAEERVGMEVLEVGPADGGVYQVGGARDERVPLGSEALAAVEEHRDRSGADRRRLGEEHRSGRREDPVERHEEDEHERGVVTEQVSPHQRHERRLEAREQPDALVVQRRVVRRGGESVVQVERALGEVGDVDDDRDHHQPLRQRHPPREREQSQRERGRRLGALVGGGLGFDRQRRLVNQLGHIGHDAILATPGRTRAAVAVNPGGVRRRAPRARR